MANAIDKAVRAQGGAVVKPHQVQAMVIAAHRAFKAQKALGLVEDGESFDAWRKATIHDVVGAAAPSSFKAVTQRDYAAVIAYFSELAGGERAEARRTKSADEERRALWALNLAEGEVEDSFGGREGARRYADALLAKIHRTDRCRASARQIWAVIFTMRKRAKARRTETRSKTALGARGASGVSLSLPAPSERFPAFSRAL
ncbi:MAG: hypothetical protein K6G91_12640 [Kiritimatiellae bacterium]|nr:hypothetical protein [Kiritimatiellia bacterium]